MSLKIRKTYGQINHIKPMASLRKYGVPPGGALDPFTCNLVRASLLVPDSAPVMEVMGTIEFEATKPMTICWMTPYGGYTKQLQKFEVQRISCIGEFAGYLGHTYQMLSERNVIGLHQPVKQFRFIPVDYKRPFEVKTTMDVSRMGFRCDSTIPGQPSNAVSEPVCPGMLQLTPSGQVIILGPDGPVTGGYHKLGVMIEADVPMMATLLPLTEYEFIPVSLKYALEARADLRREALKRYKLMEIIQSKDADPDRYRRVLDELRR